MPSELDRMYVQLGDRLEQARALARTAGAARVETRILQGSIVGEIVAFAEGFDLVVMGTRGAQRLERWLSESVAEKVVQGAPCPVLTLRERRLS
jgi:nucleotide-binding universal stress UspA family protein